MRLVAVFAWLLFACHGPEPASVLRPAPPPSRPRVDLAAAADAAFARSLQLDFEAPVANGTGLLAHHQRASRMYRAACLDGHPRSCWMAVYTSRVGYEEGPIDSEIREQLHAHCDRGHKLSCRALQDLDPGSQGLEPRTLFPPGCPDRNCEPTMRRFFEECDRGYAWSCYLATDPYDLGDPLRARYDVLAVEGCRQGLLLECQILLESEEHAALAEIQFCQIGRRCHWRTGAPRHEGVVAAWERECQMAGGRACHKLLGMYWMRSQPEPFPGRLAQLQEELCELDMTAYCDAPPSE